MTLCASGRMIGLDSWPRVSIRRAWRRRPADDAQRRRHLEAVRAGGGARRLLVLRRAWAHARLPRPERCGQDDRDARGLRPCRTRQGRGALGQAADRAQERLRFGYMPEERGLYPRMPVGEQLAYFARLHGVEASAARAAATPWLERLDLADRAGEKVEALSHGNQQRAQLAAALLHEPELLVLDEPFAGLDPVAVQTLAEVLRGEAERGAAVLFSSHQLELVEDICEDVAIIDHGRIVATGDIDSLRRASQARRIELRARRRAARVATGRLRRRARRAPQRRAAAARGSGRRSRAGARRSGARGAGRRVQLRAAVARRTLPGAGREMSGHHAIRLVAKREIRERLRSRVVPRLDADHAPAGRRVNRVEGGPLEGADVSLRGDFAGTARPRSRPATRGGAVRREYRLRVVASPAAGRQALDGKQVDALCSCPPTGWSSGRTSMPRPPRSRTPRCVRSADICHRCRSWRRQPSNLRGESHGRGDPGRHGRLPAPPHVPRRLRPVGDHRRRRGEEQPRRRADPRDDAIPPPARRQGDRDRARRVGPARADRRARCPSARRRRLRCARRARREPGPRHPLVALGFALYAVAYAAAGALASRQQSAETAGTAGHVHARRRLLRRLRRSLRERKRPRSRTSSPCFRSPRRSSYPPEAPS